MQHFEFWSDDPSIPANQDIRHPYVHQIFAITVSFLLTYRSQLAYQRFWEGRTNLQMMSARWKDAALQLFIFDDQVDKDKPAAGPNREASQAAYRGKVLHLMSVLHCFACLHLLRLEQGDHKQDNDEEVTSSSHGGLRGSNDMASDVKKRSRPAFQQMTNLKNNTTCCGEKLPRYKLGLLGDLTPKEAEALYPPFGEEETSRDAGGGTTRRQLRPSDSEIMAVLDGGAWSSQINERQLMAVVEANLFDRVSIAAGWVIRLVGQRRAEGGVNVPPPVLSRVYQLLSDGHNAFYQCKKIRDTPFPFPYAQLMRFILVLFVHSFPFVVVDFLNHKIPALMVSFFVPLVYFSLNEVARELEVPFHYDHNDINVEEVHDGFIAMLESIHKNFSGTPEPPDSDIFEDLSDKVLSPVSEQCSCKVCLREMADQPAKPRIQSRTISAMEAEKASDRDGSCLGGFCGADGNGSFGSDKPSVQYFDVTVGATQAGEDKLVELCQELTTNIRNHTPLEMSKLHTLQKLKHEQLRKLEKHATLDERVEEKILSLALHARDSLGRKIEQIEQDPNARTGEGIRVPLSGHRQSSSTMHRQSMMDSSRLLPGVGGMEPRVRQSSIAGRQTHQKMMSTEALVHRMKQVDHWLCAYMVIITAL